jgi:ABC-type Co2+ transport system permease subunit
MIQFMSGAVCMASVAAGLVFLRFWRRTGDRFFAMFAASFALLGLERVILALLQPVDETRTFVHLIRLVAFALIVLAIADKNRAARGEGTQPSPG